MPCFFNTGVHYLEECGEDWCSLIGVDRLYSCPYFGWYALVMLVLMFCPTLSHSLSPQSNQ